MKTLLRKALMTNYIVTAYSSENQINLFPS